MSREHQANKIAKWSKAEHVISKGGAGIKFSHKANSIRRSRKGMML
jgi:hypothetical protein